ncbi:MAG: HIT family protein, partial [Flavobacteriales bacterium]
KKEVDYIFDIHSKEYEELWRFAQIVAKAIKKVIRCERVSIVVVGLEVPHAHIHLIPIDYVQEINFALPKKIFSNLEMTEIAKNIKTAI